MADITNRLAGIAYIAADGATFLLSGNLSYRVARVERATLIGQDRVHGYSEKPLPGMINATIRDSGGLSVASLSQMTNVTITCELANGKTIVGRNMWLIESPTVNTEDGTMDVKWEGPSVEEV